ncbi:hypothetical protein GF319_05700 [Candidatus Bathyarchaeota archaeon]|nr:hypothetical protein [Candidatus Bathyarchaeota archaeon]
MPSNPLHFLAIAFLKIKHRENFDTLSLLLSSTLVDLELLIQTLKGDPPTHGVFHSYLFLLTVYPLVLSFLITFVRSCPWRKIFISCFIGGVSHLFFDMWTHEYSSYILYPCVFQGKNPFFLGGLNQFIRGLVVLLALYSTSSWLIQLYQSGEILEVTGD